MNFYELHQRYSEMTGEPTHKQPILVCRICDFCGARFYVDNDEQPTVLYSVQDIGGSDPWFYGEKLQVKLPNDEEIEIDLIALYNDHSHFVYCQEWAGGKDCAAQMVSEWIKRGGQHSGSLCDCLSEARHAIVKKLLENGNFSLEELSLEVR